MKENLKYSYIELNENKEIIASANFKFNNNAIENTREVVRGYDGKLYFKGEEPQRPTEEIKNIKKSIIKQNIANEIYEVYPLTKQIDIIARIGGYTDEDYITMKNFIETKIQEYKNQKEKLFMQEF